MGKDCLPILLREDILSVSSGLENLHISSWRRLLSVVLTCYTLPWKTPRWFRGVHITSKRQLQGFFITIMGKTDLVPQYPFSSFSIIEHMANYNKDKFLSLLCGSFSHVPKFWPWDMSIRHGCNFWIMLLKGKHLYSLLFSLLLSCCLESGQGRNLSWTTRKGWEKTS